MTAESFGGVTGPGKVWAEAETATDAANKATQKRRVVMGVGVKGGWKSLTSGEPAPGERG
jgi:hypothetical protein